MTATILSPWSGDGQSKATAYAPQLLTDHPLPTGAGCSTAGAGGQGSATVTVSGVDDAWLSSVAADPTYTLL